MGYDIVSLNIGNPGAFGFRTPETMRLAMIENLRSAEGYCHQKGIFPAREAVVMQQQERGVRGVTAEEVFIGNGVSELIDLVLRALLATDDEVLVPSPDYPLWTAAVNLNRGRAVHYPCRPERGFVPDPADIEALVTPRTRAIVVINPNNPTGAVYPARGAADRSRAIAERHQLVVLADEIYDQMTYERRSLRADGDAGASHAVRDDERAVQGVPRLRLPRRLGVVLRRPRAFARIPHCARAAARRCVCAATCRGNGPCRPRSAAIRAFASWSSPGGRLHESRRAILEAVARSRFLELTAPMGALYAFIGVRRIGCRISTISSSRSICSSTSTCSSPRARASTSRTVIISAITNLPEPRLLDDVFARIEELLESYAAGERPAARPAPDLRVIDGAR